MCCSVLQCLAVCCRILIATARYSKTTGIVGCNSTVAIIRAHTFFLATHTPRSRASELWRENTGRASWIARLTRLRSTPAPYPTSCGVISTIVPSCCVMGECVLCVGGDVDDGVVWRGMS